MNQGEKERYLREYSTKNDRRNINKEEYKRKRKK